MMNNQTERQPPPITNQKLWDMSAKIVECLKKAYESDPGGINKISWGMLQDQWFDWLEEEIIGEQP